MNGTPLSGDLAVVVETDARAREIAEYRRSKMKNSSDIAKLASRGSVEQMMSAIQNTDKKELPVVIKADVHGSLEAIKVAIGKIGNDNAAIHFLSGGVGGISESDVSLAMASNAALLGFNVRAIPQARDLARKENIEIKLQEQEIMYGNKSFKFKLDPFKKKCLLEGLDDIALSLEKIKSIESFENRMVQSKTWI